MPTNKFTFNLRKNQSGIWAYEQFMPAVPKEYQLTLNEGGTSEIVSQKQEVIFKREDNNPSGSLKDRGMAYLISKLYSDGERKFVLPSSGNAAISALSYAKLAGLQMKLFVSPDAEKGKLEKLKEMNADFEITSKSLTASENYSKENDFYNLRPSVNKLAAEGYKTIAFEIAENQGIIEDIFVPSSSGVGLMGIYYGFKIVGFLPRIHICQSSKIYSIAGGFDLDFIPENVSLAKALIARSVPLKNDVIKAVKESNGTGWVIGNNEITDAVQELKNESVITSNEGALVLAAVKKARNKGFNLGKTVCLLTGRKYD